MDDESFEKPPMIRDLDSLHQSSIANKSINNNNNNIPSKQQQYQQQRRSAVDEDEFDF